MERRVYREWLDELPPDDLAAAGSRRDLRRLNLWMRNAATISRELRRLFRQRPPESVMEIGAGDGWLMLQIAQRLTPAWSGTRVRLVDKQTVPADQSQAGFARLGWPSERIVGDVFQLFADERWSGGDQVIVANLFLHHFLADQLRQLFRQISSRAQAFVAVEPRRSALALAASHLVGAIGCNHVTRHDAPVSVRAGFAGTELSTLWPDSAEWEVGERRAACFSHMFVAHRVGGARK